MRDQYYTFIKQHEIQDTLSWIEDMAYSKKLSLIQELLNIYPKEIVNVALAQYEERYIKAHRIVSYLIRNTLVSLCKLEKEKRERCVITNISKSL